MTTGGVTTGGVTTGGVTTGGVVGAGFVGVVGAGVVGAGVVGAGAVGAGAVGAGVVPGWSDPGVLGCAGTGAAAGTTYRFRLDGGDERVPDPASRYQPEGPHGPSQVVDPSAFRWTDQAFTGARLEGQIAYEMHIGTFTREGVTWV